MKTPTHTDAARLTGRTRQTIISWKRQYPDLYRIVMAGVSLELEAESHDRTPTHAHQRDTL